MKHRAPAPIVVAVIIVLTIASGWALVAPALLGRLRADMSGLLERSLAALITDTGMAVRFGDASPRLLGSIVVMDVEVRPASASEGGSAPVSLGRVELRYDVPELLRGRFRLLGLRVDNLDMRTTPAGLRSLVEALQRRSGGAAPGGASQRTPRLPPMSIELRGARVRIDIDARASIDITVKALDALVRADGSIGISAAGTAVATDDSRRLAVQTMTMPFSVSTTFRLDRAEATVAAMISASSDGGRLSPLRLDATLGEAGVDVLLGPQGGLERLNAHWDNASRKLTVDSAFSAWRPQSLFVPAGPLASLRPWLAAAYSGTVRVATDMSAAGTTASVGISGLVPLDVSGGRPRLTLVASGNWNALSVKSAALANDRFSLRYSGDVYPQTTGAHGSLAAAWQLTPSVRAETALDVSGAGNSWFAYASSISAAGVALRDAALSLELDKGSLLFHFDAALPRDQQDAGSLVAQMHAGSPQEATSTAASGRLVVDGTTTLAGEPYLEAAIHIGATRLGAYRGLLDGLLGAGSADAIAPLGLEGDVSLFSDFKGLSFNSSSMLLVYDGAIKGFGVASFSGNAERLEIRSLDATVGGKTISGTASLEYHGGGSAGGSAFTTAFKVQGIPYALSGAIAGGTIAISGDYGLRLTARRDGQALVGSLGVSDMPLPVASGVVFASIDATGRFATEGDWTLVLDAASLSQGAGTARARRVVKATGAFNPKGGRFGLLSYADQYSTVSGAFDVTWALGGGFRVAVNGQAAGLDGESYTLGGEYRSGGVIDARVTAHRSPLSRLSVAWLRGIADIDGTITGTIADPAADFGFTLNAGQSNEGMVYANGSGSYHGGTVRFEDTQVRLGNQKLSELAFSYQTSTAAAQLACAVELSLGKSIFEGVLSGSGSFAGGDGAQMPATYSVSGGISAATWENRGVGYVPFTGSVKAGDVSVSIGSNAEISARLGADGAIAATLGSALPIALTAQGKYAEGAISLDVSDARVDLPFLFGLLKLPVVGCDSGVATGSLRIRGKLLDPTVEGVLQPENFYLSVPDYVGAPLGPLDEPFYFTGKTLETYQPRIACAGTTVIARMELAMHGGIPDDLRLSVQTSEGGLVPLATRLLGMDIRGKAGTSLEILANQGQTSIQGSVAINSGDIVLTTGLAQKQAPAPVEQSPLVVGLDLSFGKAVRVYFPDKRLPILYGQTDPSSHLAVTYDALSGDFSLKGTALLRGGSVFYIQRNFYLKTATMEFDENADQFDPKVSLEAETRSRSDTGPVIITLRATDRRLSDLSFTLESVPAMSEATIIQLLGQNLLGVSANGQVDLGRALVENSDLIPQLNVMSVLERNLQDVLGLDLFMVRSQVFQRWLYDFSGLSGSTTSTTLADYLDSTEIVGGKYIGDKLFFQLMLSLASNPLATGTSLSLDSEISLEWKAPHFTLYWSIQPKHPETLFIEDQSFSFLWRIPLK